jgi:hypothetical protein
VFAGVAASVCAGLRLLFPHDPAEEAALDAAAAAEDPSSTDTTLGVDGFRGLCRVKLCADLRRCSGGRINWLSGGTGDDDVAADDAADDDAGDSRNGVGGSTSEGSQLQPPLVVVLGAHNLANYYEAVRAGPGLHGMCLCVRDCAHLHCLLLVRHQPVAPPPPPPLPV